MSRERETQREGENSKHGHRYKEIARHQIGKVLDVFLFVFPFC